MPWSRVVRFAALATLISVSFPLWTQWRNLHAVPQTVSGLPAPLASARSAAVAWWPQYQGFDARQSWRIDWGGHNYDVVALTYVHERSDKKLIYYANIIAPEEQIFTDEEVALGDGVRMRRVVLRTVSDSRIVWWFYLIGERMTVEKHIGKWLQFVAALRGDSRASLVAISTRCRRDCAAEAQLDAAPLLRQIAANWSDTETLKANQTSAH
jgi:hypothetical protein